MKEVELKIHDMSTTLHPADAYALVLEEVEGGRKIPIIIGRQEAQAIKVMMVKYLPPRPLTHDLFPMLTKHLGAVLKRILIYIGHYRVLNRAPCAIDWGLISYIFCV